MRKSKWLVGHIKGVFAFGLAQFEALSEVVLVLEKFSGLIEFLLFELSCFFLEEHY